MERQQQVAEMEHQNQQAMTELKLLQGQSSSQVLDHFSFYAQVPDDDDDQHDQPPAAGVLHFPGLLPPPTTYHLQPTQPSVATYPYHLQPTQPNLQKPEPSHYIYGINYFSPSTFTRFYSLTLAHSSSNLSNISQILNQLTRFFWLGLRKQSRLKLDANFLHYILVIFLFSTSIS